MPSYNECGKLLKISYIYFLLKNFLDLTDLLDNPQNMFHKELKYLNIDFEEIIKNENNRRKVGSFKIEHPVGSEYSIPIVFYSLKEKSYLYSIVYKNFNEPLKLINKCAGTGGVIKNR